MLNKKTIAVVVSAYNEESQIGRVIDTMPQFVDRIIIVNDYSKDKTAEVVKRHLNEENKSSQTLPSILNNVKKDFYNYAEPKIKITKFNKKKECNYGK